MAERHDAFISTKLKDPAFFAECLGKPDFYADYLKYFQDEISTHGVQHVVNEYLFKRDERANAILTRMHSGRCKRAFYSY